MGIFRKLFGRPSNENFAHPKKLEVSKMHQELIDLFGEDTILPSFPHVSSDTEPLIMYQVGDYLIALHINLPPYLGLPNTGSIPVPVSLQAVKSDGSRVCTYTAQQIRPNEGPRLVMWDSARGGCRVHSAISDEYLDPNKFLNWWFPSLVKELGFDGQVEVVELKKRS